MQLQQGMTALVTGGVSGLGEASAVALLARGLNVVAVDLNEERGAAMFLEWRLRHAREVAAFEVFLEREKMAGLVPLHQLLRSASMWRTKVSPRRSRKVTVKKYVPPATRLRRYWTMAAPCCKGSS